MLSHDIMIIGLSADQTFKDSAQETAHPRFREIYTILNQVKKIYIKSPKLGNLTHVAHKTTYLTPTIDDITHLSDGYQTFVQDMVKETPVAYIVAGHPLIDEASTTLIQQKAAVLNQTISIIPTTSILPHILQILQISPGLGLQILDATLLCYYHHPPLEPHRPALITSIYHPNLLPALKTTLSKIYPSDISVRSLRRNTSHETSLEALDKHCAYLFIPPLKQGGGLTQFQETVAHLRAPNGCPWDREQTHKSLRPYLLEETYEVLAELDADDTTGTEIASPLSEELGDLLLQIVLQAQIASEANHFQMKDVIHQINDKMLRRHPHVFGDISVTSSEEVKANWAKIKAQEKANKNQKPLQVSALNGIQPTLPSLAQAMEISKKAVKAGFEWDNLDGVLQTLVEEAHEIATATTDAEREAEIGDFLFTAVNVARKLKVDPESALRATNARFTRRFQTVETLARDQNLDLSQLDKENWQGLWREAKKLVG